MSIVIIFFFSHKIFLFKKEWEKNMIVKNILQKTNIYLVDTGIIALKKHIMLCKFFL
jgi:hypothetical protein